MKKIINLSVLFTLVCGIILLCACSQSNKEQSAEKQQSAKKNIKLEAFYKPIIIEGAAPTPHKENILLLDEVDENTLKSILESRISRLYSDNSEKAAVYAYNDMEEFEYSAALCIGSAVKKPGEDVVYTLDYNPNLLKDYIREKTY